MTCDPSTVQKLNEEYLEFNVSCSEVITQPLYCPKSDVEIGYVEVSLYRTVGLWRKGIPKSFLTVVLYLTKEDSRMEHLLSSLLNINLRT